MIVNHGITIIRTNSGAADFEMNRLIKEIYMHIIKSTNWWSFEKIVRIRIWIKSFNKTKVFKMDFQKCFTKLQKMKNTQSKINPMKIGKRPGTTYCSGCKDFTRSKNDKQSTQRKI